MQKLYLQGPEGEEIYRSFGFIPAEASSALEGRWELLPFNLLTVFTSMFLHGGWIHLAGNMLFLWIFGGNVEDVLGRARFFLFYLLSAMAAAVFQFLYDPRSLTPMVGASGAVSGILGAYLVLFPLARVSTALFILVFIKIVKLPAVLVLTVWFAMQICFSYSEGTAWFAHIGGFVFGLVAIKPFCLGRGQR